MSTNLRIDNGTALDNERRLQNLLAQQAEIQAKIASLLPRTAPPSSNQFHRSPIHKQQQRRQSNVPRSMSSNGITVSGQLSQVGFSRSCFWLLSNEIGSGQRIIPEAFKLIQLLFPSTSTPTVDVAMVSKTVDRRGRPRGPERLPPSNHGHTYTHNIT